MLLASAAEILKPLGFDVMPDIEDAVTGALHAAEAELASTFRTDFAAGSHVDTFWTPEPGLRSGAHVETSFKLRNGFLSAAPVVVYARTMEALDASDFTTLTSTVKVDLEKGIVADWRTVFDGGYVRVTYSSGFAAEDEETYVLTQVPPWLQEAAKLKAMMLCADNPSFTSAQIKLDKMTLGRQLQQTIAKHLRYAPSAFLPM